MLGLSPWRFWRFSFICLHFILVIRTALGATAVTALSSTNTRSEFTKLQVFNRHKREDVWDSNDIFLCEVDDEDSMGFSLACDKTYVCTMTTFSPNGPKIYAEILDLDSFTDNCSQPFNPFYTTQAGRAANHPNLPFVVTHLEIFELVFAFTNFTRFPPRYFCKLTNTTSLTFLKNLFDGSIDVGLAEQCGTSLCCLCNLKNLDLSRNQIQIVNNFSFCGLTSLRSLTLSYNAIAEIEVNAFATLHNLRELNMHSNLLKDLPARVFLPTRKLKHLHLDKNMLTETGLESFQLLSSLEELNLSNNKISQLESQAFSSLKSLKRLYLRGNKLFHLGDVMRSLDTIVTLDISDNFLSNASELQFSSMANLSTLLLGNNNFTSMSTLALNEHASLNALDLSGNKLTSIPEFVSLKKVGRINLSDNMIRKVTTRDKVMLCRILLVDSIDLSSNFIDDIVASAFDCDGLRNGLRSLKLTRNRIMDVADVFFNTTIEQLFLNENNIEALSLADLSPNIVILDVSKNSITNFSGISPSNAHSSKRFAMRELILESNEISQLSDVYFPPTLELLNLGSNKLAKQECDFSVATIAENITASIILPANIKTVDLTFNEFQHLCSVITSIHANENMPVFRFSGNPIECPCEIEFLAAHDSKFRTYNYRYSPRCALDSFLKDVASNSSRDFALDPSKLHRSVQFSCIPRNSKVPNPCQCNLSSRYNTVCKMPCPAPCQCFLSSHYDTQVINCTHRHLEDIPETRFVKVAVNAYFSKNSLTSIGPASLRRYNSCTELYLDNNLLSSIHPAAFQDVPHAVVLHLQSNLLTHLPEGLFENLTELAELFLSDNRLALVSGNVFRPLASLGVLRLDNNSLASFPIWELQDPTLHLTLRDNPWACECRYVDHFRLWLQNFSYRVDDASDLFCTLDDGTVSRIPLISFNSSHCYDLSQTFSIFQNVPMWSSFLAVLLLLVVVSILLFVYRAEVQVLVYSRYGLRIFHHQKEANEGDKLYDAFIAFSSFDEQFVVDQILPGLESIDSPYSTCIHQRDFMVGAIITESILEAVEKSRRTLVVLSEHFVKSGWCRFEFKSAHMKMLTDRCSRVIIIVLDAVPQDLDPEMRLYMNTNTYLKWDDKLFWQKLYFALPDKTRNASTPLSKAVPVNIPER